MNITITLESKQKTIMDAKEIKSRSELEALTMQLRNKGRELEQSGADWQIIYTAKSKV